MVALSAATLAKFWGNDTDANGIRESLQTLQPIGSSDSRSSKRSSRTGILGPSIFPGTYYLEVIEKLYRRKRTRRRKLRRAGAKD